MAPRSRRRTRDMSDSEADDVASAFGSHGGKRRKLSSDAPSDEESQAGEVLPDSFRRSPRGNRVQHIDGATGVEKHAPGALVRIHMKNFVTYTDAVFKCGPSLNMIIGPNGTGKSTLVCALCLGLGFKPSVLGRAKEIGEFVKNGTREAEIEVELAANEGQEQNPVIKHIIKREGNKSTWKIDGQQTTHKEVMKLVRSFNIQIDNLCQFLPQDRVVEFAAMTPEMLLEATQKAAEKDEMAVWHTELKKLGAERALVQARRDTDAEALKTLAKRQADAQADVDRMRERQDLLKNLEVLKACRPGKKYLSQREILTRMKDSKKDLDKDLRTLKAQVQPALDEVEAKKEYRGKLRLTVEEAERLAGRLEKNADDIGNSCEQKKNEIDQCAQDYMKEVQDFRKRKQEVDRLEREIAHFQAQYDEDTVEFDPKVFNAQLREKDGEMRQLGRSLDDLKASQAELQTRLQQKMGERSALNEELRNLSTASGQQERKLEQISSDSLKAWRWLRANRSQFKGEVFGPPILTCRVKDPRYADAVESLMSMGAFVTFTFTDAEDWSKFRKLQSEHGFQQVYTQVSERSLEHYPKILSKEELEGFGLQEWAVDMLEGPEPVLAMLCDGAKLNRAALSLENSTNEQYEGLKDSPIQMWVAGRSSYRIARRREFGPLAVSTTVTTIQPAKMWTTSGVDSDAKRQIDLKIRGVESELAAIEEEREPVSTKLAELKRNMQDIDGEKRQIEQNKSAQQKAFNDWNGLPAKIETHQDKVRTLRELNDQINSKLEENAQRKTDVILERAKLAIDHAIALDKSMQVQEELVDLQIQLIEADSEVSHFELKSQEVRRMLQEREVEIRQLEAKIAEQTNRCKVLLKEFKEHEARLSQLENVDEMRGLMRVWITPAEDDPEPRTFEALEGCIEETQQRISLMLDRDPNLLVQFDQRAKEIERKTAVVATLENTLAESNGRITEIREQWEPRLDALVEQISAAFGHNFERIGCAGQVNIRKHETDFKDWAIEIKVKFRESEDLAILDAHRQSGGERAVSTIFYLMALQSLARSPFRVVDEINQGMDPRNERMMHERIVDIACEENTAQYFLVTPKLLTGLKFHPRMRVHVIFSGEGVPGRDGGDRRDARNSEAAVGGVLDFQRLAERALRGIGRAH